MKWLLVLGFALFAVGCAAATDSAPTLIPTSIPTNTPAPPPTPDTLLALGAYSTWLGEFLDRVVVANSTEMGQLFSSPLPNNDTWRFEVSQRAHVFIDGADELRVRIPPEAFAATHASMLEAMEAYAEAGSQTLKWLETGQTNHVDLAVTKIGEGNSLLSLARLQMPKAEELQGQP